MNSLLSQILERYAKFWLGLQDDFDIEEELSTKGAVLKSIKALNVKVA